MSATKSAYLPWPPEGESFTIASTTLCLATTTLTALGARLYVILRHKSELPVLAATTSLFASHVSLFRPETNSVSSLRARPIEAKITQYTYDADGVDSSSCSLKQVLCWQHVTTAGAPPWTAYQSITSPSLRRWATSKITWMQSFADCVAVLLRFERTPNLRAWLFAGINRYHPVARLQWHSESKDSNSSGCCCPCMDGSFSTRACAEATQWAHVLGASRRRP